MKRKKVVDDFNVSTRIRKAFQRAVFIADYLKLEEINTVSFILALLFDDGSALQEIYLEQGIKVYSEYNLSAIVRSKELYERVIGKKFPFEEVQPTENTKNSSKEEGENLQHENESIITLDEIYEALMVGIQDSLMDEDEEDFSYINMKYSECLENAIIDAGTRCHESGQDYIDEENLLYSIFNLPTDCSAKRFVETINESLQYQLENISIDIIDIMEALLDKNIYFPSSSDKKLTIPKPLENCCEILNNKYEKGYKCDVLERDEEIYEVWNILSKKQKSNVILLGEAGVGKSAIVEAITMSIVNDTCPTNFKGYNVVLLNVVGMVSGTKYRGEFERKVKYLIKFIERNDRLILFVDEIHQIMGAGSAEGGLDLSGSLKPLLARDKVKFIGATTMNEYKRYICSDDAFRRRLEPVIVKEPKQEKVLPMLDMKIKKLKKFHGVTISKNTLDYIQLCASCFNITTCNPDKTLDLIDRSMAIAKIEGAKSVSIKKHVEKVFRKNYTKYNNLSKEFKTSTAYHEAGHFVAHMIYKEILVDEETYAISIVPGFEFMGVNILEDTDLYAEGSREYFKAKIAALLAGRIAESFYTSKVSSGASNDLGKATAIAKAMITKYGLSVSEFKNMSVYDAETGNNLPLSDATLDQISVEAKRILDGVYENTKKVLSRYEEQIEFIANELLEKKIIKASDYYYIFDDKI